QSGLSTETDGAIDGFSDFLLLKSNGNCPLFGRMGVPLLGTICSSGGVRECPKNGRFQPLFVLCSSDQIRANTAPIGNKEGILEGIVPPLSKGDTLMNRLFATTVTNAKPRYRDYKLTDGDGL